MSRKVQRHSELFVVDIFTAIYKIRQYTIQFENGEALRCNSLHWDATIRELELIGEALNHIEKSGTISSVLPKYFKKIVAFRNVIVHAYFGIDSEEVWNIVVEKLEVLFQDLSNLCIGTKLDLSEVIVSEIIEYDKFGDNGMVEYLKDLETKLSSVES